MRAGEVIGEAWQYYKAHWRHLLPIAFVVYLLLSLFTLLLVLLLGWLGLIFAAFVSIAGVFWLQGALVVGIEDVRDGRADLSLRETIARIRPRMNTLGVAGILASIGILIGLVLLIVPGLVLFTWWSLIVPVIMLEGASIGRSFGRSRELVRGHGWSMFGLIVLAILILIGLRIVVAIITAPFDNDALGQFIGDLISNTLFAPFLALCFTLAYYRLRQTSSAAATVG